VNVAAKAEANVKEVVPFLHVSNMEQSIRYYIDGLGFTMKNKWVVDGKLRWCWLALGGAALMLQEFPKKGHDSWVPTGKVGESMSLCFTCSDALAIYHEVRKKSSRPESFSFRRPSMIQA
jgi:lactoylglutathione lyase